MIVNIKLFLLKYLHWLSLLPILFYFVVFQKYAINIPHWDDYALIKFCNTFWSDTTFQQKINLVFKQHNEHRIAITRLVSLLIDVVHGSLDFKWLMLVGNFSLIVIFYLFYKVIIALRLPKITLLISSLLIFQFSHFENTFWGMAVVQNFGVVLFIMLAIRQLTLNKIPIIFTILAVFTSANAILLLPIVGIIILSLNREFKKALIYLAFCSFLALIYFYSYESPPDVKPIDVSTPLLNLKAGIVYIGSVFDFNPSFALNNRVLITLALGLLLVLVFTILSYKYIFKSVTAKTEITPAIFFLIAIVLVLIGTGILAGLTRIQYGYYVFLVSRYRIYSILGLLSISMLSMYYIHEKYRHYLSYIWLALVVPLYIASYFYNIETIKQYRKIEIANYYNGWHLNGKSISNDPNTSFKYQNTFLDKIPTDTLNGKNLKLSRIAVSKSEVSISNNDFEIGTGLDDGAYLLFKSDSNKYIFATKQNYYNSVKRILRGDWKYANGFEANLPLSEIASGDYFINVIKKNGDSLCVIKTNYYLEIDSKKQPSKIQNW